MKYDFGAELKGKSVVITGASTGLGRVIAEACIEAGAALGVCARNGALLTSLYGDRSGENGNVLTMAVDVTDGERVRAFAGAVVDRFGTVDVLIANAGVTDRRHHALIDLPADVWMRVITTNVTGTFNTLQTFLPHLRRSRGNAVVLSSLLGQRGYARAHDAAYCTSKFAIEGLVEVAGEEFREAGVNINTLFPAEKVDTEFFSAVPDTERRRLARPEVILEPTLFLATVPPGTVTKTAVNGKRWREDERYRHTLLSAAGV